MRFADCAQTYDKHATPQHHFAARVARFLRAGGEENFPWRTARVLELGAGTGALTRHFTRIGAGGNWLATDAAPGMIERGQARAPAAQWRRLDAFREPLPPADWQVSSGLLHWAADPVAALARWRAFLRPGGRMLHALPCDPCLAEWRALAPDSPVVWRDADGWRGLFAAAGLRVRRSASWTHTVAAPSALALVRGLHLSGVTGRVRIGPARLRQALRTYETRHRAADGVRATWAWLAIEAEPSGPAPAAPEPAGIIPPFLLP